MYVYSNLPRNVIDSQGQEAFLAPSADKETRNITQSAQTTIPPNHHKAPGLSLSKMVSYIYPNLPRNVKVRPSHHRRS